jgi:hypothetical protein
MDSAKPEPRAPMQKRWSRLIELLTSECEWLTSEELDALALKGEAFENVAVHGDRWQVPVANGEGG